MDHIYKILNDESLNDNWLDYVSFIDNHDIELWKVIDEFPNYEVSTSGRVRVMVSQRTGNQNVGKVLKVDTSKKYPTVTLKNENKRRTIFIHTLVADAFIPNNHPEKD